MSERLQGHGTKLYASKNGNTVGLIEGSLFSSLSVSKVTGLVSALAFC